MKRTKERKEKKKILKLNYNKKDFFDKDGWIKYNNFKVAVGEKGEVEYCDPLKNLNYYEQNSYYIIIEIKQEENDIQNTPRRLEELITEKLEETEE